MPVSQQFDVYLSITGLQAAAGAVRCVVGGALSDAKLNPTATGACYVNVPFIEGLSMGLRELSSTAAYHHVTLIRCTIFEAVSFQANPAIPTNDPHDCYCDDAGET